MNSIATADTRDTAVQEQCVGCAIEDGEIKVCAHGTREYVEQALSKHAPHAVHAYVANISGEQAYRIAFALRTDEKISPGQASEAHMSKHMNTQVGRPKREGVSFNEPGYWQTIPAEAS